MNADAQGLNNRYANVNSVIRDISITSCPKIREQERQQFAGKRNVLVFHRVALRLFSERPSRVHTHSPISKQRKLFGLRLTRNCKKVFAGSKQFHRRNDPSRSGETDARLLCFSLLLTFLIFAIFVGIIHYLRR